MKLSNHLKIISISLLFFIANCNKVGSNSNSIFKLYKTNCGIFYCANEENGYSIINYSSKKRIANFEHVPIHIINFKKDFFFVFFNEDSVFVLNNKGKKIFSAEGILFYYDEHNVVVNKFNDLSEGNKKYHLISFPSGNEIYSDLGFLKIYTNSGVLILSPLINNTELYNIALNKLQTFNGRVLVDESGKTINYYIKDNYLNIFGKKTNICTNDFDIIMDIKKFYKDYYILIKKGNKLKIINLKNQVLSDMKFNSDFHYFIFIKNDKIKIAKMNSKFKIIIDNQETNIINQFILKNNLVYTISIHDGYYEFCNKNKIKLTSEPGLLKDIYYSLKNLENSPVFKAYGTDGNIVFLDINLNTIKSFQGRLLDYIIDIKKREIVCLVENHSTKSINRILF